VDLQVTPPRSKARVSANADRRRADIQGLRAVAVILVVLFHAGLHVPGGFTGVDVFFVISGFVITRTLVLELGERGKIDLWRFYARRIRRLLPALAVMVTFVLGAAVFLSPLDYQSLAARTGFSAMFFSSNGFLYHQRDGYFDLSTAGDPLLHTWTLGVEEQFYLFFPVVLFLVWRSSRSRLRHGRALNVAGVALITLVSFALSLWLSYGHPAPGITNPKTFAFFSSPTRAWEFGLGALLALSETSLGRLPRWAAQTLGAAGLLAILVGGFGLTSTTIMPGVAALLPTLGAAAVIVAGIGSFGVVSRSLAVTPARWVGDRSYGWYLWHWPLIVFAVGLWPGTSWAAPAAAALSLLVAGASFRYVETPVRVSPRWRGGRLVIAGALCVVIPAFAAGGLIGVNHVLRRMPVIEASEATAPYHADVVLGCATPPYNLIPYGQPHAHPCLWRVAHPRGLVVLIGDSNAGQFTEPVVAAGNRAGYDVAVVTDEGCPFVLVGVYEGSNKMSPAGSEQECLRYVERSLQTLVRRRPSLVITANRTDGWLATRFSDWPPVAIGPVSGGPASFSVPVKEHLWSAGLGALLHRLNSAHIPVLLVHPVPLGNEPLGGCVVIRVLTNACDESFSRSHENAMLARGLEAEDAALARATDTSALTFENFLCDAKTCHNAIDGVYMYRDFDHLSVDGSLLLTHRFYVAIRRHARR